MFANYLKLTFRNLIRNKLYSMINIFGLSIGILCATLIWLFIYDELSYDRHHEKLENIYRLEGGLKVSDRAMMYAGAPYFFAEALKEEYPEIEETVRFTQMPVGRYRYGDKELAGGTVFLADETVFDIFTHTFLRGNPRDALDRPGKMVLTETLAEMYFGEEDPMGKVLRTDAGYNLQISAVIADLPNNSSLQFDGLASMGSWERLVDKRRAAEMRNSKWEAVFLTYVLTQENATMDTVLARFDRFHEKYFSDPTGNVNAEYQLMATPLADVHFRTGLEYDYSGGGNILFVYLMGTIAVFLLLIAAINYMNMATAASAGRAKEIGLRKVAGAFRGQIVRQFLTESVVLSMAAMVVSVLLAQLLLPRFNQLAGKELVLITSGNMTLFLGILIISIAVGLVAGSYPAFYLSRFDPARILKDTRQSGQSGGLLRKMLIVIQFTGSIVMIIATLLVFQQLDLLKSKDLGFDKEDVLAVPIGDSMLQSSLGSYKEELLKSPLILDAAVSSGVPGMYSGKCLANTEENGEMTLQTFDQLYVDYGFLNLMDLRFAVGRNFDRDMATDQAQGFIVNETLVKKMGWGDDPIGKRIRPSHYSMETGWGMLRGRVIGVVKDFNFGSLKNPVPPMVIMLTVPPYRFRYYPTMVSLRIAPGRAADVSDLIDEKRREFNIDTPLQTLFIDQLLSQFYQEEERLSTIFSYASVICIVVSFLGLLGLSSFMTEQRTKEIGIRKVLGASVPNLVSLLSQHFIVLAIIANLLAWPFAYVGVTRWLENYPHKTDIGIMAFAVAGALSLVVTLLAVGFQAFKAASANPIQSLRAE